MHDSSGTGDPSAAEVIRGLLYAHHRANLNTNEVHQVRAALEALIALLVERGALDADALEAYRREASDALRTDYVDRGMTVALQEYDAGKYDFAEGVEIDCAARIPTCRAACCRLRFALTKEDVEEGVVRWDLGRPYMNALGADGYCVHLERGACRCTIHAHRPIPCRGFDCRTDTRIWLDFEANEVNPRIYDPDWPRSIGADAAAMEPDA